MPRIIDLFPVHNDTSPVSGDAMSFDPNQRLRIMEPVGKKQELKFQCFRGPGCTACSRSPVLRAATESVRGMEDRAGTIKDNVANVLSAQDRQAPLTTYRAVEPLPEGIDAHGNAEVLLIVMTGPNHVDSETWAATTLRQMGWKGYIVFEVVVRCGTGDATDKHIEACTPYLVHTLQQTKAKRVMVCGTPASKAMTGNTMHPWNYGSWTHVPAPTLEDGTPDPERILVVSCPDPAEAWRNKFIARFFRRAALMAMKMELPEGLPDIKGRVVETLSDFKAFKAWVPDVPWLSYDVEWTGTPHNADFNFVCCAFSHPDYDTTWIFHDVLGVEEVHNYLRELLQTKPIVAQNVAAEFVATQLHFGVEMGHVEGDTMLAFKLLNVDSKAALEDLAYYIGYNSHKAEMNAEMEKHKVAAAARASTKVGGASYKGYIMDLIDPEVLLRYNALDTHITGELHVESVRRMKKAGNEFLHDTYREFTLPATRLLHRIHCNGMRVDKKVLELSREALASSVKDIEQQLRSHSLDTPSAVAAVRSHLIENGMFDRLVADHGHNETKMQRFMSGANNTLSTDKYTLKAMKDYGDVPKLVLEWREMMKLYASYGDTLGTYIRNDGRVHPSYRLDGARTGRLCVHPETMVLTQHGEVAIKDLPALLAQGEVLTLTHRGQWQAISAAFIKGREEMFRVTAEDGSWVTCTGGHRLWADGHWVACRDLKVGSCLGRPKYSRVYGGGTWVRSVEPVGMQDVWDLTVPGDHSYTAQGLVHHNSVNSPNTTQIPKHGKHSAFIKNCFCAEHGQALVAFDYKTLEVFVAAIISGDLIMQEACRSADFHLETAKKMAPYAWNCTPEDVEHEVLVKKDKTKRTAAKGITFSVLYGAGPHSLADTLNCSFEQADMLMKSYAQAYPTFAAWVRATHAFAQENGYVHIPWNGQPARLRPLIGAGFAKFGGDGARFSQAMRQSQNSPPQGMAAQYAIMASIDLETQFRSEFGTLDRKNRPKVIAMVHDSIIVETPQKYMEEVVPRMYHAMTSLPTGCDLRLQVDAEVGETWGTLESIDLKQHVGAES